MKNRHKYKSDAFEAIHSTVAGMYKAGTVDKETMRSFDESCLTVPDSIEPAQIKSIRESQQVSPGLRQVSQHQRIDRRKVGSRSEEAQRHGY